MLSQYFAAFPRSTFGQLWPVLGRWPAGALLACLLLAPEPIRAQFLPDTAGRIEGNDITVEGGPGPVAGSGLAGAASGVWVANGSVVTVHSGRAHLALATGGEVDVCGPAKFTLLESGGAITLALDFGRLRLALSSAGLVQIYTPQIVATPLAIVGGTRDITLGLELSDSLCVLAAQGAIRLEQQFTAENIVVPQGGDFFLTGGKLVPVASAAGSCRCAAMEFQRSANAPPPNSLPETGLAAPPTPAPAAPSGSLPSGLNPKMSVEQNRKSDAAGSMPKAVVTESSKAAQPAAPEQESRNQLEFSVPARANDGRPLAPAAKIDTGPPPPVEAPTWKVFMPPLTFSSAAPAPPPDPSPQTILLIRETHVEPDWVFHGRVEGPPVAHTPEKRVAAAAAPAVVPVKMKVGFWAKLRRFFGGGPPRSHPCQGSGCA